MNKHFGQSSAYQPPEQLKRPQPLLNSERMLCNELHYFCEYVQQFPKTTQSQLLPYLEFFKHDNGFQQLMKEKVAKFQRKINDRKELQAKFDEAKNIIHVYKMMVAGNTIATKLMEMLQRAGEKVKSLENDQQFRGKFIKKHLPEFYPQKIDKTDSLSKEFESSYRLSKMFGTHSLSHHDRKAKDSAFELVPRLINRVQEIAHYQSNAQHLGNILMLTYEGNKIRGNKGYAVVDNNRIQWWEKRSGGAPEISLVVENQQVQNGKDGTQKIIEEKQKQPNKENRRGDQHKFKLTQTFIGHSEKVTSVSISYDQLYLLSTGMDKCIKLWCLRLKTLLAQFYGHMGTVWDVEWAATGYYFLTGGADKMAILWKTDVPAPQRIFEHHGEVYKVNFLKNPDFVCTAGEQGIFRVWKVLTGECVREINFPSQILNFELSFSGAYMGLYEISGQISIYDISKGQKINSFRILEGQHTTSPSLTNKPMRPHDIAFSEDEKQFVVVTSKHVMLYSIDTLGEKQARNIYEFQEDKNQKKSQPPKEVIYMGRDVNLTYCKYTRKNLLVVGGTRKVAN